MTDEHTPWVVTKDKIIKDVSYVGIARARQRHIVIGGFLNQHDAVLAVHAVNTIQKLIETLEQLYAYHNSVHEKLERACYEFEELNDNDALNKVVKLLEQDGSNGMLASFRDQVEEILRLAKGGQ